MVSTDAVTVPRNVRVFILADVCLYREGLADSLSRHSGFEVVGTAPVDRDGFGLVAALRPDIVLLEAVVACTSGVIGEISASSRDVSFVAYGVSEEEREALECAAAGVAGYVSRDATLQDLVRILLSVVRHEFPCSPRIAALMLRQISNLASGMRGTPRESPLTLREREILSFIEDGLTNKEIAGRLGIELSTVKNHVHHVLEKLKAGRRGQAAAWARRLRITSASGKG